MINLKSTFRSLVTASALTFVSLAAHAAIVTLKADLKGASEVPPNDAAGKGSLTATLDTETNVLNYHVEFSELTGPVVAAHFHGPAAEGAKAKPQISINVAPSDNTVDGKATITPEQAKDLLDGKWYFNLHTGTNAGGEVRGQIHKAE